MIQKETRQKEKRQINPATNLPNNLAEIVSAYLQEFARYAPAILEIEHENYSEISFKTMPRKSITSLSKYFSELFDLNENFSYALSEDTQNLLRSIIYYLQGLSHEESRRVASVATSSWNKQIKDDDKKITITQIQRNAQKALEAFEKARDAGSILALYKLAHAYHYHYDGESHFDKAIKCYKEFLECATLNDSLHVFYKNLSLEALYRLSHGESSSISLTASIVLITYLHQDDARVIDLLSDPDETTAKAASDKFGPLNETKMSRAPIRTLLALSTHQNVSIQQEALQLLLTKRAKEFLQEILCNRYKNGDAYLKQVSAVMHKMIADEIFMPLINTISFESRVTVPILMRELAENRNICDTVKKALGIESTTKTLVKYKEGIQALSSIRQPISAASITFQNKRNIKP